ncbi:helix-turn-helix transcriptional regulator [Bacillus sp. ISL-57]|uniref:helix-turn-helix domain-containing protein n=1 Tax=Bacillus sp. ISL-57 TaxID=2819135 RepID=UPI001BE5AADF|nr:helix-turn-helix transcriptional regulator [Bacillus sp. ISL-57]MBT2718306.1 helix-turn-helix domain-containing protein [Bacillus sp. ISL-57]
MGDIKVKLNEVLEEISVSPNKFAVESKIRSNTIYDLVNNKTKMITWKTLVAIIDTLNRIAEENNETRKFNLEDIIEYIE